MRAREIQRIVAVLKGWSKPCALVCLCIWLLVVVGDLHAQPQQSKVSAAEQSSRDDERLRILREELRKSEALVESLARRKAERLAAADVAGADEAEEQRIRALSDVAGLKREIGATRPSAQGIKRSPGQVAAPVTAIATNAPPSAPWWDVYGKDKRGTTAAPVSYARPSRDDGARHDPDHRPE